MGALQVVFHSIFEFLGDKAALLDHLVDHFILDALSHVDGTVHVRYLLAVRHVFNVVAQMLHLRLQIVVFPHVDLSEVLDVADGL